MKKTKKKSDRTIWIGDKEYPLPHTHREQMFKISYTIEFELVQEMELVPGEDGQPSETTRLEWLPQIQVSKVNEERSRLLASAGDDLDYVDEHFSETVQALMWWLFYNEAWVARKYRSTGDSNVKNRCIKSFVGVSDRMIRSRIPPVKRGAPRKTSRKDTEVERELFRELFIESVGLIIEKQLPMLNQSGIAKMMGLKVKGKGLTEQQSFYRRWAKWGEERDPGFRDRGKKMSSAAKHLGLSYEDLLAESNEIFSDSKFDEIKSK